jgi:hypothetical protein
LGKNKSKWFAISSLIIGILITLVTPVFLFLFLASIYDYDVSPVSDIPPSFYLFCILLLLAGIIPGIFGLQSRLKVVAIVGIILTSMIFLMLLAVFMFITFAW